MFWSLPALSTAAAKGYDPSRWEPRVRAFEASDSVQFPGAGGVLFVGSSSISRWSSLQRDLTLTKVINRGMGGSRIADILHFADRIIVPYRPRLVVVYAGENDLAHGMSPAQVVKDFRSLVAVVRAELPATGIAFISIKPSPARWHYAARIRLTNRMIRGEIAGQEGLKYIDVFNPMLAPDGLPAARLFVRDRLHLNRRGYELWAKFIRPYLCGRSAVGFRTDELDIQELVRFECR